MNANLKKTYQYFRKMSAVKKVLVLFIVLLLFIILIEQPGSDASKRRKSTKYFVPKLVVETVSKIEINPPEAGKQVILEKQEGTWQLSNGHFFPADEEKVNLFLKAIHSLKEDELVSTNPERMSIFGVDEKQGVRVVIWNHRAHNIVDFYAGKNPTFNSQFVRKADEEQVIKVMQNLNLFLSQTRNDWRDKTLMTLNEAEARRFYLKSPDIISVIEKEDKIWRVIESAGHEADSLALRTLFEQLKRVQADAFVQAVEGSQVDFEEPAYQLLVRLADGSTKSVLFAEKEGRIFAKSSETDFIYSVSESLIENIFGLKF